MCPAWGGGRVRALWLRARCLLLSLPPLPVTVQGRDWAAGTLGAPTTAEVGARAGAHAALTNFHENFTNLPTKIDGFTPK